MLASITDQIKTLIYLSTQKNSPKPPDPTTVVPDNRKSTPLDSGKFEIIGGMWTLKIKASHQNSMYSSSS